MKRGFSHQLLENAVCQFIPSVAILEENAPLDSEDQSHPLVNKPSTPVSYANLVSATWMQEESVVLWSLTHIIVNYHK